MLPSDRHPNLHPSGLAIVSGARRIAQEIRRHHLEEPLSWLACLLTVALFATWTLAHYHAPAEPAWLGMTIHSSVFAAWPLVLRVARAELDGAARPAIGV